MIFFRRVTPKEIQSYMAAAYDKDTQITSVNGFLINTGTKLVLVDTGTGGAMGPTVGKFMENLKASGYTPEQIDEIYLTHMPWRSLRPGLTQRRKEEFPERDRTRRPTRSGSLAPMKRTRRSPDNPMMKKTSLRRQKKRLSLYKASGQFKPF